jgi:hypothetical protein
MTNHTFEVLALIDSKNKRYNFRIEDHVKDASRVTLPGYVLYCERHNSRYPTPPTSSQGLRFYNLHQDVIDHANTLQQTVLMTVEAPDAATARKMTRAFRRQLGDLYKKEGFFPLGA